MADYRQMQAFVMRKLEEDLPKNLFYHSIAHTQDVLDAATRIGKAEGISEQEMHLLQSAAVMHDTGFLDQYFKNEPRACQFASDWLPQFGYSATEIELICNMILATSIPQAPQTQLEKILCDADLDYLGRPDFYEIGNNLFREFLEHKVVDGIDSWNCLQIGFLQSHVYFTETSKQSRSFVKNRHLSQLQSLPNVCI